MAIYHCSVSNVSRAAGSSSCATLSYISGRKIRDERTGTTYDYGRKERVEATGTLLPDHAPSRYKDAAVLFNEVEKNEKTANARTAKKIEVALPREFYPEQQIKAVEDFIRHNLNAHGYAATYAIHTDKENNNPHAHILVANRQINSKGEWSSKRKMEYALDERGQRIPRLDKDGKQVTDKNGRKQWVRVNAEQNPLDKKDFLQELRKGWAQECNKMLLPEEQIDHRSHADRGINQIPTIHEGYAAREIAAREGSSERVLLNEEIKKHNSRLSRWLHKLKHFKEWLLDPDYFNKRELARITDWIEQHDKGEIFSGEAVPPFEGQERLAEIRAQIARYNDKGDWDLAEQLMQSPEYEALRKREGITKQIVRSLTISVKEGDKPQDEMLRRFKSAKHKAEQHPYGVAQSVLRSASERPQGSFQRKTDVKDLIKNAKAQKQLNHQISHGAGDEPLAKNRPAALRE